MRVSILSNSARYIWNFRISLMENLRKEGYEVIAISPAGAEVELIENLGFRHVDLSISPQGTNVFRELGTVFALRRILARECVDVVLSSTPKGNLYSALANRGSRRRQIANVSGLGSAYIRQDWLTKIIEYLYRLNFSSIDHVLFENPADHNDFLRRGWVSPGCASVIPGLGVDLTHFNAHPLPPEQDGGVRFLMIARLIGDKGVREYVAAARRVRAIWQNVRFDLLGDSNAENPSCIPPQEIELWKSEGVINHFEHVNDVRPFIRSAHCIVLPSYREGMSRTLLEGGSMGRPLIASDVPGCREAIEPGVNGFLCRARNADSLVEALTQFLMMNSDQRQAMGDASREKISKEFSEEVVIQRYVSLLADL